MQSPDNPPSRLIDTDLSFFLLNEATAIGDRSAVTIDSNDSSRNDLKLVLVNTTGTDQKLSGGTPQPMDGGTASTLYFSIPMQLTAENNAIALAPASKSDWLLVPFDSYVGLCPAADYTLPAGADAKHPVLIHLTNIAASTASGSDNIALLAQNCPAALDWADGSEPVNFQASTTNPPFPPTVYQLTSDLPGGGSQINITSLPDANVLTLTLVNSTGSTISPKSSWGANPPQFTLRFAFGSADDDVAPLDLVDGIHVECPKNQSIVWRVAPPTDKGFPEWVLHPDPARDAVLDVGDEVAFVITRIITEPDVTPNRAASLSLVNRFLPDYQDGSTLLYVTKGHYPKIVSFWVQSQYQPDNRVDAATGVSEFACYAGDTIDINWESCGSEPTNPTPCTFVFEDATPVNQLAVDKTTVVADKGGICQLICHGAGAESDVFKSVNFTITPPVITSFVDESTTPAIRLSWAITGVKYALTLEGPGIDGKLDVTGRTTYMPPTTANYHGTTYTYKLTCDDGVNPPVIATCAGTVRQPPTDLVAVFTPLGGGVSMWVPGQDAQMIAAPDPNATIADISVGSNAAFATPQIKIFWVDSANGQLGWWVYGSPFTAPTSNMGASVHDGDDSGAQPLERTLTTAVGGAATTLTSVSVAADYFYGQPTILARDASNALYYGAPGGTMSPVIDANDGSPVTSALAIPRIRRAMNQEPGHDQTLVPTGPAVYFVLLDDPGGPVGGAPVIPPPGTIDVADFTINYYSADLYWLDKTAGKLVVSSRNYDGSYTNPRQMCDAVGAPAGASLTMDYIHVAGGGMPCPCYCYWMESTGIEGLRLLCRCMWNGNVRQEIAVIAVTPGHSGLAVLGSQV